LLAVLAAVQHTEVAVVPEVLEKVELQMIHILFHH
tara:strand:- start:543 stop:647 length:105 start_codon:yes stop_codon:yes gene_type:complete